MKILIIGLDRATPELLFGGLELKNVHRLMEIGCYGRLEGFQAIPNATAWMSMITSRSPEPLGRDESAGKPDYKIHGITIWDHLEAQKKRVTVINMPEGIFYPPQLSEQLAFLMSEGLSENKISVTGADQVKSQVYDTSQRLFDFVRQLIVNKERDYFQFVDTGFNLLQTLSNSQDSRESPVHDYYLYLDEQVGMILELLTDDTIVLVVAAPGPSGQQGGFVLASTNNPLQGKVEGAHLLDISPTLLELGGYEVPESMQGRSLVTGFMQDSAESVDLSTEEEILRERLSGLGYIE